jgi:single-stranded-DNA-specific exonuclease
MRTICDIITPDSAAVQRVCDALGCLPMTAAVLVNRGVATAEAARAFMDGTLSGLRPPFGIRDMDAAVRRIAHAIAHREKILIFGDYDVDGITATTLLLEFLRETGADVSFYIPHRTREGYDFQVDHVLTVAIPQSVDLIITVDCGSTRHEAVRLAGESGIDVVVTDHHTIGTPPPAEAVVNPRRSDCGAGFDHLSGVGVAFALLICLRRHLRESGFWADRPEPNLRALSDLVALGTVADMVPLVADNRILSRIGISELNRGGRHGVAALARAAGLADGVHADDIAFRLAPRLNVAGRLGHARTAVELLTTRDARRAEAIAEELNRLNRRRQETEKRILDQAAAELDRRPELLAGRSSLVLAHPDWHEGVLGIVAAKLVDRYWRPVILMSARPPTGKGSGRSIPGINLHDALVDCAGHLEKFGGHPMAAGLQIATDRIDAFREAFEAAISAAGRPDHFRRTLPIDAELDFDAVTDRLVDELESLGPFGEGHPEPLFLARNVTVDTDRIVGRFHRRMTLRPAGARTGLEAIRFNVDPADRPSRFDALAFRLRWNRWNGRKRIQLVVETEEIGQISLANRPDGQ